MMINKELKYDLSELKEYAELDAAQLLYEKAVRGEEIDRHIKNFFASEYSLSIGYHRREWFVADRRGDHCGEVIRNPDTQDGGFSDLTALLKWCIEKRRGA